MSPEIPCLTCQRPNECRKDRRCNRPTGLERAIGEAREAAKVFDAASVRLTQALAGLLAALTIHRSQQP